MKNYLMIFLGIVIALSACKKNKFDAAAQAVADDKAITAYIAANNADSSNTKITATKDANGLYYQILTPGNGGKPTVNSTVTVNYAGKLLNGTQFDKGNITQPLTNLIKGWQLGVPHVSAGGRILLIIPSALGYGNVQAGPIPANSPLVFTIDLLSYK